MNKIRSKAKKFVKRDGGVFLPVFEKNENGEYESKGQTEVFTLKELKQYFEAYNEIAKIIKENYKREIYKIYKGSLGNLVLTTNNRPGYLFDDYNEGWTDNQYDIDDAVGIEFYSKTLKRIISGGAFTKKRLRPGKGIIDFMKNPVNDGLYLVLPEMSDKGIVVVPDKSLSSLAVKFNKYSLEDAKNIKTHLLNAAYEIADSELSSMAHDKIVELFDASMQASIHEIGESKLLRLLGKIGVELMGVDMTPFEKIKNEEKSSTNSESSKAKSMALGVNGTKTISEKLTEDKISAIVIEGLNLINQQSKDGKISTVITPVDNSLGYKVTLTDTMALISQDEKSELSK